jgi:putative copper resistance protein D
VEAALAIVRLLAFVAGTALFGAPLFALYSGVTPPGLKRLASLAGLGIALAAAATLILQTGQMAGDPRAGLDPATVRDVIAGGAFGASILVRLAAGLAAPALVLAVRSGRGLWTASAALGALALGALPWSGHGAADEATAGVIHVAADIAHLLAAGAWLGALGAFGLLLAGRDPGARSAGDLYAALKGFSGIGSGVVAVIVASGLANSWFLVGPDPLAGLIHSLWGDLLLAKLAAVAAMLGLAGLNRYRLTPALGAALPARPAAALPALRRSIVLESALGLLVLALVAVLGMQPPPAAG